MSNSLIVNIVWLSILGAFLFSIWKGGTAERLAGSLVVAMAVVGFAVHRLLPEDLQAMGLLTADFALAVGFLILAVRYASLWLGGMMLLQAVQFSLHAWYLLAEKPHDLFYSIVNNLDTVGILLCLILGTAFAWRRRTRALRASQVAAEPS